MQPEGIREISRIEMLVHPFYDLYLQNKDVPVTLKEAKKHVDKWKQRIREIAADPNAILIIVTSPAEKAGQAKPKSGSRSNQRERLGLKALEKELYDYAGKVLGRKRGNESSVRGNRLFLGMERIKASGKGADILDSYGLRLNIPTFKRELKSRKMRVSPNLVVWAYGSYLGDKTPAGASHDGRFKGCVNANFELLKDAFPLDSRSKIVHSLSIPLSKFSKVYKDGGHRGSMEFVPRKKRASPANANKEKKHLPIISIGRRRI